MKVRGLYGIVFFLFLLMHAFTACSDDDPEDNSREIKMSVSPEMGIMYSSSDDKKEHPIECMLVMSEDAPGEWKPLAMNSIEGFTYEKGHEYYLSVKRTILPTPSTDGSDRVYSLISILQDRLIAEPDTTVGNEIKSETDIVYNDLCPFRKYSICTKFLVNDNGEIFYDGGHKLPSYSKSARIWLENILDKGDANWLKFQSIPYQAYYSFVLSPFTDRLSMVYNNSDGPMFKDVVPEEEFNHIKSMKQGEQVRYSIILANIYKKGLQKLEFVVEKK